MVERETMEFDVVIVGAGPAGLWSGEYAQCHRTAVRRSVQEGTVSADASGERVDQRTADRAPCNIRSRWSHSAGMRRPGTHQDLRDRAEIFGRKPGWFGGDVGRGDEAT